MGMYDLLKKIKETGDDITVITCKHSVLPDVSEVDGMKVFRLSKWQVAGIYPIPKVTVQNAILLYRACRGDCDLVYTRTRFFFTTFIGYLVSVYKKKPMLHTEPGTGFIDYNRWWINMLAKIWDYSIGRLVLKRATCVGVSVASTNFIKKLGAGKATTIYNGIDRSVFYDESEYSTIRRADKLA